MKNLLFILLSLYVITTTMASCTKEPVETPDDECGIIKIN
jgi:hypothetical protein